MKSPISTDDILKRIFLNENVWISIKISVKFSQGANQIYTIIGSDNDLARTGDKP